LEDSKKTPKFVSHTATISFWLIWAGLLISPGPLFSQHLVPNSEVHYFERVNAFRIFNVIYDSSKQKSVDRYALSDQLIKYYRHSGHPGEIICKGSDYNHFFTQWRMSPGHRKVMRRLRNKSMCMRVVKVGNEYYGVIRFYQ